MQVTETLSDGLKRSLRIVVPATELNQRLDARLEELKGQARINGFRPGKVPTNYLRKLVGRAEMARIVNDVIGESIRKAVEDRQEKPALNPDVDLDDSEAEKVVAGEQDLAFTANYELLPTFELQDFSGIEVERLVAPLEEDVVEERLRSLAERLRSYAPKEDGSEAANGDRVTIDFVGRIDGEAFEGGSAEGIELVLGSSQFIPGFEDQLVGAKPGEARTVTVTFPEDYPAKHLAGKQAVFDVTLKAIAAPGPLPEGDDLAKGIGIDSLEELRRLIRAELEQLNERASRQKVKRQVLDQLDQAYRFELPQKLVDSEFESIWKQATEEMAKRGRSFADENTTEEAAREEYRRIAERRVRLGLVLSDIGEKNNVQVSDDEVSRALVAEVRKYPENQQRQVFDYYRENAAALASLRAPIFEEKVIDLILSRAKVNERQVSRDELFADGEE